MKQILTALLISALIISCDSSKPQAEDNYATILLQQGEQKEASWNVIKSSLAALPSHIQERLAPDFYPEIEKQIVEKQLGKSFLKQVFNDLSSRPKRFPLMPGVVLSLKQTSPVDSYVTNYHLQLPKTAKAAVPLIVFLGKPESFPKDLAQLPAALAFVDSRKGMNYQLLAEADFINTIQDIQKLFPTLKRSPIYIVGQGDHADSALLLANNHFSLIEGIAFSGGKIGLDLKNLDLLPITHYNSPDAQDSTPWGGKKLIQTLQKRGNARASYSTRTLSWVLNELLHARKSPKEISQYTFSDYQFARVNPWLKIVAKKSEFDPVKVSVKIEGDVLHIEGFNIASCQIHRAHPEFPSSRVSRIRLNNHLFTFTQSKDFLYIGSNSIEPSWEHKSQHPSGFVNYFRNEPLYLVYQAEDASSEFLKQAKEIANKIARLEIIGYPSMDTTIPILTLQEYLEESLPDHRAIIIAKENIARKFVQVSSDYLPLTQSANSFNLFEKETFTGNDQYAYGISYPPEAKGSLKQALLLCSNDSQGLEAIKAHYTVATAFENHSDLIVWRKKENSSDYQRVLESTFNDSWHQSFRSKTLLATPKFQEKVWKFYLKKLLTEASQTQNLILPPLVDSFIPVPSKLSHKTIGDFIPNKYFAKVKISSWKSTHVLNKLLSDMRGPIYLSMGDLLEFDPDSGKPQFNSKEIKKQRRITFLLEARQLQNLPAKDLAEIDYEILPFSIQELLLNKIMNDKASLGKELITLSNKFYPGKEQIGQFVEITNEWEF
ncbi:MAG: hypothetical protein L7U87_06615 [Chlamydiales bacterium]|nr:hypothetical protein [Chlamydiales bacterium]